jgi:hypothetical protein
MLKPLYTSEDGQRYFLIDDITPVYLAGEVLTAYKHEQEIEEEVIDIRIYDLKVGDKYGVAGYFSPESRPVLPGGEIGVFTTKNWQDPPKSGRWSFDFKLPLHGLDERPNDYTRSRGTGSLDDDHLEPKPDYFQRHHLDKRSMIIGALIGGIIALVMALIFAAIFHILNNKF